MMLVSYLCVLPKAGTAHAATLLAATDTAAPPSSTAMPGLDVAAIDALYPNSPSTRTSPAPVTTAAVRAPSASASSRAATSCAAGPGASTACKRAALSCGSG